MLSIYPTIQKPLPGSACVTPREVFADYDCVMARLTNGKSHNHSFRSDMETSHLSKQPEIYPHIMKNTVSTDKDRACELRKRPNTRTQQAAADISNKYSGRFIRNVPTERRARKSQPYHDGRRQHAAASSEATNSNKCTYIYPENGERCGFDSHSRQGAIRHWRSCHFNKEAKLMLENKMAIGEGTAITSMAQLEKVKALIMCRYCGQIITRTDSMRRHVNNCTAASKSTVGRGKGQRAGSP